MKNYSKLLVASAIGLQVAFGLMTPAVYAGDPPPSDDSSRPSRPLSSAAQSTEEQKAHLIDNTENIAQQLAQTDTNLQALRKHLDTRSAEQEEIMRRLIELNSKNAAKHAASNAPQEDEKA